MKRKEYVFAAAVIGILLYHHRKLRQMGDLLEFVGEGTVMLLDESYQGEVDETFEEIVETSLDDLDL